MRCLPLFLGLGLAAACGGSTGPGVTPPPPPAPIATTIVVQAGDAQEASPGASVAVKPAVLVKDGSGRAMAGVAVTFAVDSGGGAVVGSTTSTGADGIATVGNWTLGAGEGRNVLLATAGTLPPVRIGATALYQPTDIGTQSIGAGGGSLTVTRPGTPVDGLWIDIPAGVVSNPMTLTVQFQSSAKLAHTSRR